MNEECGTQCESQNKTKDVDLKAYVGTKLLLAKAMNEKDWNISKGMATNDNPLLAYREGFLVIYDNGYQAWSPKDVFDTHYRLLTDSEKSVANF